MRQFLISILVLITAAACTHPQEPPTFRELRNLVKDAHEWDVSYDIETTVKKYRQFTGDKRDLDVTTVKRIQHHDGKTRQTETRNTTQYAALQDTLLHDSETHELYRDGAKKSLTYSEDGTVYAREIDIFRHTPPAIADFTTNPTRLIKYVLEDSVDTVIEINPLDNGTLEVTIADENDSSRFVFDPARNYLFTHATISQKGYDPMFRYTLLDSIEATPGNWIRTAWESINYDTEGGLQPRYFRGTATIHSIDQPIAESVFTLEFPEDAIIPTYDHGDYIISSSPPPGSGPRIWASPLVIAGVGSIILAGLAFVVVEFVISRGKS